MHLLKFTLKVCAIAAVIFIILPFVYVFGSYFYWQLFHHQITQSEANVVCQKFHDRVKKDISSVPGFTILKSDKNCTPDEDEAGATDYYFTVDFDVAKSGNESIDGLKANINDLASQYPNQNYDAWIENNTAQDSISNSICVWATMQIQEDGTVYQSSKPQHYPRYTEPGKFNMTFRSSCTNP